MRPVIIGAGRGSRLQHLTEEIPKTLVSIMGRPMLEWILEALSAGGFSKRDVVFICGYRADVIQARYPEFTYVENRDWEHNNILLSLLTAREHLRDGFVSTYAVVELSRTIRSEVAAGEFIGVTKFTAEGASELAQAFDRASERFAGKIFREKRTFERAYLIDLLQDMIEGGSSFHRVDTHGGYMEIDTLEDRGLAASWWEHPS